MAAVGGITLKLIRYELGMGFIRCFSLCCVFLRAGGVGVYEEAVRACCSKKEAYRRLLTRAVGLKIMFKNEMK